MNEEKLSKVSLLLLINEIIKVNIELLRRNKIELSSCDSTSDDNNDISEIKEHVTDIENKKNQKQENNKNEKEKEKENELIKLQNSENTVNPNELSIITFKMKEIGLNIGKKLVQRMLIVKHEFNDVKDILKFLGKDVWFVLFNKYADRLHIYKKGSYIVVDNNLEFWLKHLLIDNATNQKKNITHYFLTLIIGILTGVLKRLNVKNHITYDLNYPQCTFQINITE